MKNVSTRINHENFEKLVKILGTERDNEYRLQTLSFSMSTDRSEKGIAKSIVEMSNTLNHIAKTIGCKVEDLEFYINYEYSDHETACHELDLNPSFEVGGYAVKDNKLVSIVGYKDGVYEYQDMNGQIGHCASHYLDKADWDTVFRQRDNADIPMPFEY